MINKPEMKLPDAVYLVGMMWLVQLAQALWPGDFGQFGIYPRQALGLLGIPIAPWIHHGWWHLAGNSIPFLVLGFLLQLSSRKTFWEITIFLVLISGAGTWLIGSPGYHSGASGLVLGYWSYLLANAYFNRSIKTGLIATVVFMLYGGLLFTFFDFRAHISWAGHVSGMLAGILAAGVLNKTKRFPTLLFMMICLLSGCATAPSNPSNICKIFNEKDDWYDDAMDSYEKWGVPVPVQMAIIHQESRFQSDAQPPRKRFLGFIPTFRPSSAYGYAQALDGTWTQYLKETGNSGADRDDFEDATDFVGWYGTVSHRKLGISKADAYRQYLAYHEGQSGYRRRSYKKKRWLMKIARKVDKRAKMYGKQLARCRDRQSRSWW